jgi:hypothetical protein
MINFYWQYICIIKLKMLQVILVRFYYNTVNDTVNESNVWANEVDFRWEMLW